MNREKEEEEEKARVAPYNTGGVDVFNDNQINAKINDKIIIRFIIITKLNLFILF